MRPTVISLLFALLFATPTPAELSDVEKAIVDRVDRQVETTIEQLVRAVGIPSATENLEGVRQMSRFYEEAFERIGFETRWFALPAETGRAGHFVAERAGTKGTRVLFIGHLDTVLEGEPWRREGNLAFGSGIADMKGGNAIILAALTALNAERRLDDRRLIVVFTGDEESPGEPHSVVRETLVEAAKRSDVALAYEGAGDGTAVVGRRGICTWRLEVTAETGHSSGIFSEEQGSGAIFEASRILTAFHERLREPNLTFNPAVIVGGTEAQYVPELHRGTAHGKTNVVPARVVVEGDLRFLTPEQLASARERMRAIVEESLPRSAATIEFFDAYPSMAPTDGNRELLRVYDAVSQDLGFGPVTEYDPGKRGAGDISFVTDLVDGLDGLGAFGEKSHAPGEYVEIDRLRMQIQRTAILVDRLLH